MTSCAAIGCHADAVTLADGNRPLCTEHAVAAPAANYSLEVFDEDGH